LEARVFLDRFFAIFKFEKIVLSLDIKKGKKINEKKGTKLINFEKKLQKKFYIRFQ